MDFFDDDFGDIIDDFLRDYSRNRERFISGEDEERMIDLVEDKESVYLIFEMPGFNEEDISIKVNDKELRITAKKSNLSRIRGYLYQKLKEGYSIKKNLPETINANKIDYSVCNGIVEIKFKKKVHGGINGSSRRIKVH